MLETFDCVNGRTSGTQVFTSDGQENDIKKAISDRKVIDFILYRGNGLEPGSIERRIPLIRERWSRKHCDLSDHFPVSVSLSW